ncbi:hypothetical protein AMELA_G00089900 [Ameiurus melas]|uniref:Ig-like domain-containing protein n=1 Tax=Ameiurus melas TaxID=219545 RepID=A0A7J6AVJ4_AMEME|nr:hypothetical protein AMELA_G00089900 [Ameiurus melas]
MVNDGRSLVYFLFLFSVDYVYSEDLKTGTSYTFRPSIQGTIEAIDWRHNGYLVVEWVPGSDPHFYRYQERASLNTKTGDFTLQLKKEDSGVFRGQFQVKGVLQYFERTIVVLDYVYSEDLKTGTSYTFRPSIQGTIEAIDWRHNGYLVVDWEPGSDPHFYRYKERASLDTKTGDFTLQLKKEDSGVFRGQFQVKGVLQEFERRITVIDPVSDPKVICEQNDMNITLLCSVDPPVQAEFKWRGPNGFSQSGNSVHITKEGDDNSVYFCTAENKVSQKTTEFDLNKCTHKDSEDLKTGTSYTFRPSIQGTIEILDWRHNGYLVVEWEPGSDPHFYRYQERASLDTKTGDFTLRLMKKEDSGVFRGQFQVKGVLQEFERTITVIDPVPKPKVTCEQNGMNITLRCSVEPSVQAEFTWSGPNGFSESGNSVHITKESDQEKVYFCIAKNSVSHTDTEFNLNMCPHKDYVYSEDLKTGTSYTFRPSIQGTIESIDWRHNGYLVVDWESGRDPQFYRYKERASLDTKTGDFTLQLKKEDSGVFRGQFQVKGVLQYFERTITVIGK